MILFDARVFVIEVQRRHYILGYHPRAKSAGSPFGYATIEDQLHMIGTTDVQVFTDNFFKKNATGKRSVQHLSRSKL